MTTGHEWNGIEELDTPIPRVVLFFLAAGTLFSIVYWILMPAWPLGWTYTRGLLGIDQRDVVTEQVHKAAEERSAWTGRLASLGFAEIAADDTLMRHVRDTGRILFSDNCAACHGTGATGGPGFPNLTTGVWLWGGKPETLAETITIGINAPNKDTRVSQMLAFGREGILTGDQVGAVTAYVRSLSGQKLGDAEGSLVESGTKIFAENCASCHGKEGKGQAQVGAPDLTDQVWIYGGDAQSIRTSIYYGRQGHMPAWRDRLTADQIKLLALYVGSLDGKGR